MRLQRELQQRAFHDDLTGLPNRALFTDRVSHALARSARDGMPLAVLCLGIDNFKTSTTVWDTQRVMSCCSQ